MYIEGHWETVDTLQDVVRIIRDNYSYELADKMEELMESIVVANDEFERLNELEMVIQQIRDLVY
jgi:hypothetical protein